MIAYSEDRQFQAEELGALFSSVQWESARYPERLTRAMQGYSLVISAREEGRLVGLLAAMDDGEMTAYIHYLLVAPDQQRRGIGKELIARAQEHYTGYEQNGRNDRRNAQKSAYEHNNARPYRHRTIGNHERNCKICGNGENARDNTYNILCLWRRAVSGQIEQVLLCTCAVLFPVQPFPAQEFIDSDAKLFAYGQHERNIGKSASRLPFGDRLFGYAEFLRKLTLRPALFPAHVFEKFSRPDLIHNLCLCARSMSRALQIFLYCIRFRPKNPPTRRRVAPIGTIFPVDQTRIDPQGGCLCIRTRGRIESMARRFICFEILEL